jgi:hypothetical protein
VDAGDGTAKIEWLGKVACTADELLDLRPSRLNDAVGWLRRKLERGPLPATKAMRLALKAGISKRTFDRARKHLGVKPRKGRSGSKGQWTLSLPQKVTASEV